MQIQLSDRWLLTLNATAEVVDMVLPRGMAAPFLRRIWKDNPGHHGCLAWARCRSVRISKVVSPEAFGWYQAGGGGGGMSWKAGV